MAERTIIQIPFAGGVDERTDKRHVVPGKLTSLVNGVFEKDGSIRKRRGYTSLGKLLIDGSGFVTNTYKLAPFGDELLRHDGYDVHSYSDTRGRWAHKDDMPAVAATRTPVVHSNGILQTPDIAYGNGYTIAVWTIFDDFADASPIFVTVTDVANGNKVYATHELAADGQLPRTVVLGTTAYVFWQEPQAGNIKARTLDLTTLTSWTSETTVINDALIDDQFAKFDICTLSDRIAIVYTNNLGAGNDRVNVKTLNAALGVIASVTVASTDASFWEYAIAGTTGERIWLAFARAIGSGVTAVRSAALNDVTLAVSASALVENTFGDLAPFIGICRVSSTTAMVSYFSYNSTNPVKGRYRIIDSSIVVQGGGNVQRHVWTSRPFMHDGRCYSVGAYAHERGDFTSYGFLFELPLGAATDQVPLEVARIAGGRVSVPNLTPWSQCSVATIESGRFAAITNLRNLGTYGIDAVEFEFLPDTSPPAELGSVLHFVGGVPCAYDGARCIESTFALPAEQPYDVQQTTGTGSLANGTYQFVIVFTRHDTTGQIYRSVPSLPLEVVVNGANPTDNTVTFQVPSLPFTRGFGADAQSQDVTISVYMTKAGGSTFYEVDPLNLPWGATTITENFGPPFNDPKRESTLVQIDFPDSFLEGRPLLYTTGGVHDNDPAPSARVHAVHKDRLWLAGTDEPKIVWFSKKRVLFEGPGFSPLQTITVEDGGAVTALASLDSHLVIFKRDRVFFVDGDGPPDTGGEGFTPPQRVSSDIGCIEPRSLALTPDGLYLQSSAGIYLLDRGLGLTYMSGGVEDTLSAYPVITGAVTIESSFQVRFSCTNVNATSGVVLVWDYLAKQWSVFELTDPTAGSQAPVVAACSRGGAYTWGGGNFGGLFEESSGYLDGDAWVFFSLETAWLKLGGLQGWQRAWSMSLLGERHSPHDLTIEVANDYADSYHQTKAWTEATLSTFTLEQIRTALVRQKCQAVRFKIADGPPNGITSGTGQGATLTGLAVEAAVLRKTRRLPAVQRG